MWNGDEIYCLAVQKKGKSILKLDSSGIWEEVLAAGPKNISSFCFAGNNMVIAGENNGINNLFLYDPSGNSYHQVTSTGLEHSILTTIRTAIHYIFRIFFGWVPDSKHPLESGFL
ncbi:MAG: hypothetical protein HC830_13290 [Bacteroidetes bacterium]|nr:hypothetical protein [Bacteroidota bacterium]